MALLRAKVLKDGEFEGKPVKAGDEVVVNRKASLPLVEEGLLETYGEPLDPRREEDRPLVEKWNAEHQKTSATDDSEGAEGEETSQN